MGKRKWTEARLIREIRRLQAGGVDLSPTGVRQTHGPLFSAARSRSHFGSWKAAIEAAGLDYAKIKRGEQVWSQERVTAAIREAAERGEDLLSLDFKNRHKKLYSAACAGRYFGSWRRALIAAGLDYDAMRSEHFWSKARIVGEIGRRHREGLGLNWSSIDQTDPGLYRAARRKENFGSWRAAVAAAGIDLTEVSGGRRGT